MILPPKLYAGSATGNFVVAEFSPLSRPDFAVFDGGFPKAWFPAKIVVRRQDTSLV